MDITNNLPVSQCLICKLASLSPYPNLLLFYQGSTVQNTIPQPTSTHGHILDKQGQSLQARVYWNSWNCLILNLLNLLTLIFHSTLLSILCLPFFCLLAYLGAWPANSLLETDMLVPIALDKLQSFHSMRACQLFFLSLAFRWGSTLGSTWFHLSERSWKCRPS